MKRDALPTRKRRAVTVDRVAGFWEVDRARDGFSVSIEHPEVKPDEGGMCHIELSPRQARHLASLLMMHAEEVEAQSDVDQSGIRQPRGKQNRGSI
jgi:hypothetical protein